MCLQNVALPEIVDTGYSNDSNVVLVQWGSDDD